MLNKWGKAWRGGVELRRGVNVEDGGSRRKGLRRESEDLVVPLMGYKMLFFEDEAFGG